MHSRSPRLTLVKLLNGTPDIAAEAVGDPVVKIDGNAMTATAVICTPTVDRDGEVILPAGIDIESRYRKNPVVMWDHGFSELFPLPIARCETEDGELDLRVSEEEMEATAHFSQKDRLSEQIFHLIDDNVIRATSVRVDPDLDEVYREVRNGVTAKVYPKSTLIEWSWGAMGVNPDTVRKALDKNKIAGRQMHTSLYKTLTAAIAKDEAKRPTIVRGWNPKAGKCKTCGCDKGDDEKCACDKNVRGDLAKMGGVTGYGPGPGGGGGSSVEDYVSAAGLAVGSLFRSDSPNAPIDPMAQGDPAQQGMQAQDTSRTPSGRMLSAVRESINELVANIEGHAHTYENPTVRAFLSGFVVELQAAAGNIDSLNSQYGMVRQGPLEIDAPPAADHNGEAPSAERDPPPSDEEEGDEDASQAKKTPPADSDTEEDSVDEEDTDKKKTIRAHDATRLALLQAQVDANRKKLESLTALG